MFDFFKKLLKKDSSSSSAQAPQFPPSTIDTKTEEQVLSFCRDIADLLRIDLPLFLFYGLLYSSQGRVLCQFNFDETSLPPDAEPHAGYYFDDLDIVIVTTMRPKLFRKGRIFTYKYEVATPAEIIFTCCHELRHAWQKKYHPEEYYRKNAVGIEIINDIAEVDADAFAIAYMCSRTPYKIKDMPTQLQQVALQATLDKGKRWDRARELYKEYDFGATAEIVKLRKQLEMKYADLFSGWR